MAQPHTRRTDCRICGSTRLSSVIDLGLQPPANAFLDASSPPVPEQRHPLELFICLSCNHAQLLDVVPKEDLFSHYLYFSTTSRTIPAHFAGLAKEVQERHCAPGDLVVEIGSNDGVLLSSFQGTGVRVLGVEPATNVATAARARGVETMNAFFDETAAREIVDRYGHAKVILANNVVGHIDDLQTFIRLVAGTLSPLGTFIFEVPYLVDLLEKTEFDTIYHEHVSYFALRPVEKMLSIGGLRITDVRHFDVHGGTIRVYAKPAAEAKHVSPAVAEMIQNEVRVGLNTMAPYEAFGRRVQELRRELLAMLAFARAKNLRVAGYGAPAKGNTLLNFCGIGPDILEYIQDSTPVKQGLLTPGMRIPVVEPATFREKPPDIALLLAWNFEREILAKEQKFREAGGKFLVPIPFPRYV